VSESRKAETIAWSDGKAARSSVMMRAALQYYRGVKRDDRFGLAIVTGARASSESSEGSHTLIEHSFKFELWYQSFCRRFPVDIHVGI